MKSCFMFGHRDCPDDILPKLEKTVERYYVKENIRLYYVGNRGNFDRLAAVAIKKVKEKYLGIDLLLVLAYHPSVRPPVLSEGFDGTFYPPIERIPPEYSIIKANQYMIDTADAIICYVKHFGNTRNLLEHAEKNKKLTICENLAE